MYGRKVSFVYPGIKKQCSLCFGPHIKFFWKNERMSLPEYAERFRLRNPTIPEHLYGRLAKIVVGHEPEQNDALGVLRVFSLSLRM